MFAIKISNRWHEAWYFEFLSHNATTPHLFAFIRACAAAAVEKFNSHGWVSGRCWGKADCYSKYFQFNSDAIVIFGLSVNGVFQTRGCVWEQGGQSPFPSLTLIHAMFQTRGCLVTRRPITITQSEFTQPENCVAGNILGKLANPHTQGGLAVCREYTGILPIIKNNDRKPNMMSHDWMQMDRRVNLMLD